MSTIRRYRADDNSDIQRKRVRAKIRTKHIFARVKSVHGSAHNAEDIVMGSFLFS